MASGWRDIICAYAIPTASQQEGPVWFWNPDGTWQEFMSQWYPCDFEDDQVSYRTTEMYMMHHKAMLFDDKEIAKKILEARTPKEQKDLGRQVKRFDSEKWNQHKVPIVEQGNLLKFQQAHATKAPNEAAVKLSDLLLQTKGRELVEASPEDRVWGIGFSAEDAPHTPREKWGENLLGQILTRVRAKLDSGEPGGSVGWNGR